MKNLFLWLHAASFITWFGGLFFYVVVASPVVRKAPGLDGMRFLNEVDRRFRHVLWGSVEIVVVTGVMLLVLTMLERGTMMKISGAFTRVLMGKLLLTLLMFGLQLYNQIRIQPDKTALAERQTDPERFASLQVRTVQIYTMELILAVGLVMLGLQMGALF